ncbi:uncharacterized protein J8A68_003950 [[Candida] subhashii]|uniref:Major facilitator superfamily (MFS) profile domain-containing protein n=1 Tax=[Candida] subhashii TaxID=561895 RepID=A0A8J5QKD5_9ASCO|nr:uncharacterized protein J8A68_003950 [[Candida] subhashii]KAG7662531.1 hypothetical protein J8A68_003950 [[Candida] subhashii]
MTNRPSNDDLQPVSQKQQPQEDFEATILVPQTSQYSQYIEADAGDGTKAHEQYLHGLPLMLTIASCVIALFLVALDQTIVSTILTIVGEKFDSFAKIAWLTSGFSLPMACLSPSYGKLSIAFGRKNTMIAGIIIFEIGSLISALSTSMGMLIGGRTIQGIGGGAIQAMVMVIFTECVPISKRSLMFASTGVVYSTASVLGPVSGGALEKISWRWCFYINLPIGGVALAIMLWGFNPPKPKGNVREKLAKVDFIGTLLLATGLILVLLALTFGGIDFPWNSAPIIVMLIVGGIGLVLFMIWNFRFSNHPIILKEFLITPQVLAACISGMFNSAYFISNLTYLALYFQVIFNASSFQSGIYLLPMIISVTISSISNTIFITTTSNIKITMLLSGILSPIGTGLMLLLSTNSSLGLRIGVLIVSGIPIGLSFQSTLLAAQLVSPKSIPGALILVTVFVNFLRNVGATVSVDLSELLFQTTGTTYINDLIRSLPPDSPGYLALTGMTSKALISNPRLINNLPIEIQDMVLDQFMKAFKNVFYLGLGLASVCCVASLFTTNKRIPKTKNIKTKEDENDGESGKRSESQSNSNESTVIGAATKTGE